MAHDLFPMGWSHWLPIFRVTPFYISPKHITLRKIESFKENCKIFVNGQKVSTILGEWTNFIHDLAEFHSKLKTGIWPNFVRICPNFGRMKKDKLSARQ